MNIAVLVSRILLGLAFVAAGLSGFLLVNNPPPAPPGLAGAFQDLFFRSRWVLFVDAVEFLAGVLLLANRYVAFALTLLGGVISNILAYHITMAPAGLPIAAIVTLLWTLVASRYRSSFAPLFSPKPVQERALSSVVEASTAPRRGARSLWRTAGTLADSR
jgi:putative oxidoreductase